MHRAVDRTAVSITSAIRNFHIGHLNSQLGGVCQVPGVPGASVPGASVGGCACVVRGVGVCVCVCVYVCECDCVCVCECVYVCKVCVEFVDCV